MLWKDGQHLNSVFPCLEAVVFTDFVFMQFSLQDEEIQNQARLINQLKEQMAEQEDALKSTQVDSEKLQSQISSMQSESETSKTEVKEVLQALEELAVNYDQKLQEVETKTKDNEKLSEELSQKQVGAQVFCE